MYRVKEYIENFLDGTFNTYYVVEQRVLFFFWTKEVDEFEYKTIKFNSLKQANLYIEVKEIMKIMKKKLFKIKMYSYSSSPNNNLYLEGCGYNIDIIPENRDKILKILRANTLDNIEVNIID